MKMETTRYEIRSPRLPSAFDGFTIAHITDLHNREFGARLIERIEAVRPDIIAVTGDTVHRENESGAAEKCLRAAAAIAPVYFVAGNHESVLKSYAAFRQTLTDMGVRVLSDRYETLTRGDDCIAVLGMRDPAFFAGGKAEFCATLENKRDEIVAAGIPYTVLLSHRPELFEKYAALGIDVTLCGHAHGGHVRLPFIGAFYAPNQGLFPKYTEGLHTKEGMTMAIGKGLGKSSWVPRIFNPPELAVEVLRCAQGA